LFEKKTANSNLPMNCINPSFLKIMKYKWMVDVQSNKPMLDLIQIWIDMFSMKNIMEMKSELSR
jgi:hypothetical protein